MVKRTNGKVTFCENPQQNDFTLDKGFGRRAFESQGVASDVDEDVSAS